MTDKEIIIDVLRRAKIEFKTRNGNLIIVGNATFRFYADDSLERVG